LLSLHQISDAGQNGGRLYPKSEGIFAINFNLKKKG